MLSLAVPCLSKKLLRVTDYAVLAKMRVPRNTRIFIG